jgi:hypothetical protein
MLGNPVSRVIFRNKALDYFGFAVGPENIDLPASSGIFSGIFPSHECWSPLKHRANMRLWPLGSSQPYCRNQTDQPIEMGRLSGLVSPEGGLQVPAGWSN